MPACPWARGAPQEIPVTLRSSRIGRRTTDLRILERATAHIDELNQALDRQLAAETIAAERMRLLREATNRITRSANDGIQAYRRAVRALRTEDDRSGGVATEESRLMNAKLSAARQELLRALAETSQRYPWATPWGATDSSGAATPELT